jgi:hypothetical protein
MQGQALHPLRANPVAGAFVATIVLTAVFAPPVLILGLVAWLLARDSRTSPLPVSPPNDLAASLRNFETEMELAETDSETKAHGYSPDMDDPRAHAEKDLRTILKRLRSRLKLLTGTGQ